MACEESFAVIQKAKGVLGHAPKYSNTDALLRDDHWRIAHLNKFSGKSGMCQRLSHRQGILAVAKRYF